MISIRVRVSAVTLSGVICQTDQYEASLPGSCCRNRDASLAFLCALFCFVVSVIGLIFCNVLRGGCVQGESEDEDVWLVFVFLSV